jgi:hypothetical protein
MNECKRAPEYRLGRFFVRNTCPARASRLQRLSGNPEILVGCGFSHDLSPVISRCFRVCVQNLVYALFCTAGFQPALSIQQDACPKPVGTMQKYSCHTDSLAAEVRLFYLPHRLYSPRSAPVQFVADISIRAPR